MGPNPRVSIVLPARDAAATLPACLASIARQTFTGWECIVLDDGSSDGTLEVAEDASRRDARVRVVSTPQRGLVAALNEGLRRASAPLVARMDADDLMHRDRLAAQVFALERDPGLSAVGCHVRLFPRRGLSPRFREYEGWLNGLRCFEDVARDVFIECPVAHPTLVMRRELAALEYADNGWPEDYDLVLRALGAGLRIGIVPRRLLCWRDSAHRVSRTDPRYSIDRFTACKAYHLAAGFLSRSGRYILWGYGSTGRTLRRALATHGKRPSHIVEVSPARIGQHIHGAPVSAPDALPALPREPLIVSVARVGPRAEVRAALSAMGFVEGKDYLCAA